MCQSSLVSGFWKCLGNLVLGLVPRNSESCDGKQCLGYQKDLTRSYKKDESKCVRGKRTHKLIPF